MEQPPPCEGCAQPERELALVEREVAAQEALSYALKETLRVKEARITALEQRLLALERQRG